MRRVVVEGRMRNADRQGEELLSCGERSAQQAAAGAAGGISIGSIFGGPVSVSSELDIELLAYGVAEVIRSRQ